MKKLFFFLIFLGIIVSKANSQTNKIDLSEIIYSVSNPEYGKMQISQDSRLQTIVKKHIERNEKQNGISGWRVQIFLGSGSNARTRAQKVKTDFLETYLDLKCYIVHESPYFKVRVGDFRSRVEALKCKNQLEKQYPTCWIVKDIINFPKID